MTEEKFFRKTFNPTPKDKIMDILNSIVGVMLAMLCAFVFFVALFLVLDGAYRVSSSITDWLGIKESTSLIGDR